MEIAESPLANCAVSTFPSFSKPAPMEIEFCPFAWFPAPMAMALVVVVVVVASFLYPTATEYAVFTALDAPMATALSIAAADVLPYT